MDTLPEPAQVRPLCLAYALTGAILLTIGLPGLLVGAFTGLHILMPALGFLAVGAASVAVSSGIAAGSRKARLGGIALAALLTTFSLFDAVKVLADAWDGWPAAFFWVAASAPVAAAGGSLLRIELKERRRTPDVPPKRDPISSEAATTRGPLH